MASIDYRPNGTLRVCWRYEGRQQRVTVDHRRDADLLIRWLAKNGPRPSDDPDLLWVIGRTPKAPVEAAATTTVGDALDALIARRRNSVGTVRKYTGDKGRMSALHRVPVTHLTRAHIEDLWDGTDQAPGLVDRYAENTWRATAATLKAALTPHGRGDLLAGYVGKAKTKTRDPLVMTPEQMDDLVLLGDHHGIGDLLLLLTDTGARMGEAVAMRGTDVELVAGDPVLKVREQLTSTWHAAGTVRDREALKTDPSSRDLPVTTRVLALADRAGTGHLTTDPIEGGPWRYHVARERLARVSADAIAKGIVNRPVHFHDFRHSWGAHLLLSGVDIVTVSRLMGHGSVRTTDEEYGHLTLRGIDKVKAALAR